MLWSPFIEQRIGICPFGKLHDKYLYSFLLKKIANFHRSLLPCQICVEGKIDLFYTQMNKLSDILFAKSGALTCNGIIKTCMDQSQTIDLSFNDNRLSLFSNPAAAIAQAKQ